MAREARVETERLNDEKTMRAVQGAAIAGLDKKAEDVRVLDIRGLASYADYLVLMSANNDRQVNAVADAVDEALRECGHRPIGIEGVGAGNWILIDAGDVVVHVFHSDARQFYDLDSLWADARRVAIEPRVAATVA